MAPTIPRRSNLHVLAIVILLVGVSAGSLMYWHASQNDGLTGDDVLAEQEQSKAYQLALDRNVGAIGALVSRWSDTLAKLGEPKPLAITIMVVSCAVAGGCWRAARRQRGQ